MSKKKDKRKNKKNKTNTKNNEAYLRRESINVGQLNTQKIVQALYYVQDKILVKFMMIILNLPIINYEKAKLTRISKNILLGMTIYNFVIDDMYIIGLVVNDTNSYFIDNCCYDFFEKSTKLYLNKINRNCDEYMKFYLQLNVNDYRKDSKLEEFYLEKDNIVIIKNLVKFRELYYKTNK